jgi:hypothetical protein
MNGSSPSLKIDRSRDKRSVEQRNTYIYSLLGSSHLGSSIIWLRSILGGAAFGLGNSLVRAWVRALSTPWMFVSAAEAKATGYNWREKGDVLLVFSKPSG